ncbi:sugar phosphate nucleotidyltransferase [Bacillus pseudomycoides]|uniref:sugar phosphate nucleotidyltransferase n=1 Tax=Bacillus pseudomycoides TaxID=64104 RepID=UPI0023D9E074|nr:sugar phosphate nucleotidyltransferase [Bacillus pseudomycoides]MDF2082842.1 sugar phosphate nucleotidyltransferase [Bacillus pseudomycoides]
MKLILLSGGSGKRLWPLSNDSRSKQFLKVLRDENGNVESMIQRIWRQICSVGLENSTYIATNKSQTDIIQSQLSDDPPLIIEPDRRDTFPAISLAATYLHSVLNVNLDETVCVMPVDAYVEDSFFKTLLNFENVLTDSEATLALIGVQPSYPSEQYGYIVPNNPRPSFPSLYMKINHFIEKPDQDTASNLINEHALWNCGVFAFKLGFLIQHLSDIKAPLQYEQLTKQYFTLPQKSFDYEIVEKCSHIVAIPYKGAWRDLGTWNTLSEIIETPIVGKGMVSDSSCNTHLINELNLPVIVAGLSNSIVVTSPDGILVADKSQSGQIKEFIKCYTQRPMYEERRWGWYRVLDYSKLSGGNEVLTKRLKILADKNLSYQMHCKRQEVWSIISGEGEIIIDGIFKQVKPGDVIQIPVGTKHALRATSDLEFIEVQMGSELIEEDIVRIYMTWEEIKENLK